MSAHLITKRLFAVLLVGLAIPTIGFLIGFLIIEHVNRDLLQSDLPGIDEICSNRRALRNSEIAGVCSEYFSIKLLRDAGIYAGLLGLLIPIISLLGSYVCGTNRTRLAMIFSPLVRTSLILLSASVFVQGIILTYAAYLAESYAIGRVHYFIIGGIGLGAMLAAFKLITSALRYGKNISTSVIGEALSVKRTPHFINYVNDLAARLGARRPDNIVVGLEPTFFATSAEVRLLGNTQNNLKGETLFVSVPLMRLLTPEELSSVIGHELCHFRDSDTAYSLKFAPVYAGLAESIGLVGAEHEADLFGLSTLPAVATLAFIHDVFALKENAISRDRELEADLAGAQVSSPKALANALVKVSLYAPLWSKVRDDNIERLNEGKITTNLGRVFEDSVRYDVEHHDIETALHSVLNRAISHPTDTHSVLSARLQSLNVSPSDINQGDLLSPSQNAGELLDNIENIEEELSVLEHKVAIALGHVEVPDERRNRYLLRAIYSLAASMVVADGEIKRNEVRVAEEDGKLIEGFDPVDFREVCRDHRNLPDCATIAGLLKETLDEEEKMLILQYLRKIASADGSVGSEEVELLTNVSEAMGVPVNPFKPSKD